MSKTINSHLDKISFNFFLFAIIILPFSFATKDIIGKEITWVDPSLVIILFVFLSLILNKNSKILPRNASLLISSLVFIYFLSSLINFFTNQHNDLEFLREPLRFGLSLLVFYTTYYFSKDPNKKISILSIMGIAATLQFFIAIYFLGVFLLHLPSFLNIEEFVTDYFKRQLIFYKVPIPRLGGTFFESPPFGLYMLCSFLTSYLLYKLTSSKLSVFYIVITSLGVISSFSDQIIFSYLIIVLFIFYKKIKKSQFYPLLLIIVVVFITYISFLTMPSYQNKFSTISSGDYYGTSAGERYFHIMYSIELFLKNPKNIMIGIGPGIYGEYVSLIGMFPNTTTPQVTFFEILCETGAIGFFLFTITLVYLGKFLYKYYGLLGLGVLTVIIIGDGFQANWKWSSVFLMVGVFLVIPNKKATPQVVRFNELVPTEKTGLNLERKSALIPRSVI